MQIEYASGVKWTVKVTRRRGWPWARYTETAEFYPQRCNGGLGWFNLATGRYAGIDLGVGGAINRWEKRNKGSGWQRS
jgi:hypothetical protein